MTMIMEQPVSGGEHSKSRLITHVELAADRPEGTFPLQDLAEFAWGGRRMSHEAFTERILIDLRPEHASGEHCLNCSKAGGYMVPAGRTESGNQVLVHAGECYLRLKWWAEEPIRRAHREAAPEVVRALTDEDIRLVLDQVIEAGVRSRRSEIEADAHRAERARETALAAELPVVPCPAWCAGSGIMHEWESDLDEFHRYHERPVYESGDPDKVGCGVRVQLSQCERWQDDRAVLEELRVDASFDTADLELLRAASRAVMEAAAMAERLTRAVD